MASMRVPGAWRANSTVERPVPQPAISASGGWRGGACLRRSIEGPARIRIFFVLPAHRARDFVVDRGEGRDAGRDARFLGRLPDLLRDQRLQGLRPALR